MTPFQPGQVLCVMPDEGGPGSAQSAPIPNSPPQRYQLHQHLGGQESWQTWRAIALDAPPGEWVILKLIAFGEAVGWRRLKLFEREIATVKAVQHPQLPTYRHSFSLQQDQIKWWGFAQDDIPGHSLRALINQEHHFQELQIRQIATETLAILKHLHGQQPPILHRDIKPSNLILGNQGQVFLIDLGAVQRQPTAMGESFTVVGTYGYSPMEQFGGRAVPASDLYALGATLIHLLTGLAPADTATPLAHLPANTSGALRQWLTRLTQPEPLQRYGSASEALRALEQLDQLEKEQALDQQKTAGMLQMSGMEKTAATKTDSSTISPSPIIARSYPSPLRKTRTVQASSPERARSMPALATDMSAAASPRILTSVSSLPATREAALGAELAREQGLPAIQQSPAGGSILSRPQGSQAHIERSPDRFVLELPGNDFGSVVAGFGGVIVLVSWLVSAAFLVPAIALIAAGLWLSASHHLHLERQPSDDSPLDSHLDLAPLNLRLWRKILGQRLRHRREHHTQVTGLSHTLRTHDQRPDIHQSSRTIIIQTPSQEYRLKTTLTPAESQWILQELRSWIEMSA